MNRAETLKVCRYVKACCPHQPIDEFTPDAWHDQLAPYPYAQVQRATKTLAGRERFLGVAEIIAEVKRIRKANLDAFGTLQPPAECSEGEAYRAWLKVARKAVADQVPPEPDPDAPPAIERAGWEVPKVGDVNELRRLMDGDRDCLTTGTKAQVDRLRSLIQHGNKIPTT